MSNFIDDESFKEEQKNHYQIIKIILIMIILLVLGTIIIRSCSKVFDDKEIFERKNYEDETKYDIDKPFRELEIYSQLQLEEYLYEVSKYLKPVEFQYLIDWDDLFTKYSFSGGNWDVYENGWDILEQHFVVPTHNELIRRVVYKGNDWSRLPLSEKFREKFKGINIPEYYGFKEEQVTHYYDDGHSTIFLSIFNNGTTFSIDEFTGNGEETNRLYFSYCYDEDGYLDDIIFEDSVAIYDALGNYITKKDKYLMNTKYSIKTILQNILPNEDYLYVSGNEGYNPLSSPFYYENVWKEIGMTNSFKVYFENLNGKGFLPEETLKRNEVYDELTAFLDIESIDIEHCHAIAKVSFVETNIIHYYDIYWITDEEYRLNNLDVVFNREEQVLGD